MEFDLSPEHEMIRQTARDFAEKEIRPVAAHGDKTGEFPNATIAKMAGRGFLGMAVPAEYEGPGLCPVALGAAIEHGVRISAPGPLLHARSRPQGLAHVVV